MARYRKIDVRTYADGRFRSLSRPQPNGQTLWIYLLTGEETTIIPGLLRAGEAALAEQLGWTLDGFRRSWRELEAAGMAQADWSSRLVWVPKAIRYNEPDNTNVVKSWRDTWDELPECGLKASAWLALLATMEERDHRREEAARADGKSPPAATFAETFRKACPKPSHNGSGNPPANGSGNRFGKGRADGTSIQEQEQEQETDTTTARAKKRGAIHKPDPVAAEAAPPPPAAEAAAGPTPTSVPEAPLAAPDLAPVTPPEGAGKAGSDQQASTTALPDDDIPRRPLRLVDTSDLGPLGAEWRCDMERASGWKIPLAAVGRREQVRKDLEAACEALGLERAVAEGLRVVGRRTSQGLGPPGSWAFFVPALQDVIAGKELMPPEARVEPLTPEAHQDAKPAGEVWLFTRERWEPLAARLGPLAVEQLRAEIGRMVAAVESEGLWTSARNAKLAEVEEYLWTKWSGRAAAGGG